ncbi:hypothetical protein KR222_002791, partial [Zaprionus bogoriensis]
VPYEVLEELEIEFQKFKESESCSLLKKHLTEPLFDRLKRRMTPTYRSTLMDCIRSGLHNLDSKVGIYAPDPEAYSTFRDIFDPIINDYHGFKGKQPASCFGYGADFPDLDPERKFIISTRIRCGRSIKDFPFGPRMTRCHYTAVQNLVVEALRNLCSDHCGKYMPLFEIEKNVQTQLINENVLFKEGDCYLMMANAMRFWPLGRGLFSNGGRTFIVWLNAEDHIRIISMDKGGNLGRVYERMIIGVESIAHQLKFAHDARLGYLTMCPTNVGTSVRASVHMRLPYLCTKKEKLEEIANKYHLEIRGTDGVDSKATDGIYDISNKRRMGMTEYQLITNFYNAINELVQLECYGEGE